MAEFGEMNITALPELSYQASFGNLPNKSVYMDAMKSIDKREEIKAAMTTQSDLMATGTQYSATSGSIPVLVPTVVDPQLYDITRRDTPLASGLLQRVTNIGLFADYIRRTALPGAKFKAEAATLASANATYDRYAQKMSYIYAVGELSGPLMIASRVWQDALRLETEAAFRSLKELEEDCILNGNPTAADTSGTVTDETAFTGLRYAITTYNTDNIGAAITIELMRTKIREIREAKGHPNLIVTDYATLDAVKGLIQSFLMYDKIPQGKIAWGIQTIEFEGIPIIPDLFMPTTAAVREMLFLDTSTIQMRLLQDAMMEELGKTADTFKFMIKSYLTMIVINEAWCGRLYNLA